MSRSPETSKELLLQVDVVEPEGGGSVVMDSLKVKCFYHRKYECARSFLILVIWLSHLKYHAGIDYQPGDSEYFEDFDDDEEFEGEVENVNLETLSLIAAKEAELGESTLAEKIAREMLLSSALSEKARRDEEQRAEDEFVNAERKRVDQFKREREAERQRMEAEEQEEQEELERKIAAAAIQERGRKEKERNENEKRERDKVVANIEKIGEGSTRPVDAEIDENTAEIIRKAEEQRLKREAFLNDMNAFSQSIEEDAKRASKRAGEREGHQADPFRSGPASGGLTFSSSNVNPFDTDEHPLEFISNSQAQKEKRTVRFNEKEVPGSFKDLTSSLFAANASNATTAERSISDNRGARDDNENIWGDSEDYARISRASNLAASLPPPQIKRDGGSINQKYNTGRNESSLEDDEEEGSGGATSISNILTKDERKVLSVQQKVAWKALQADLTTRRKGNQLRLFLSLGIIVLHCSNNHHEALQFWRWYVIWVD